MLAHHLTLKHELLDVQVFRSSWIQHSPLRITVKMILLQYACFLLVCLGALVCGRPSTKRFDIRETKRQDLLQDIVSVLLRLYRVELNVLIFQGHVGREFTHGTRRKTDDHGWRVPSLQVRIFVETNQPMILNIEKASRSWLVA